MTEFFQKDVIELAKEVSTLCKKVVADKEVAISKIPLNSDSYDARITAYSKLINSLNSLQFALTFLSKNLMSKTWWINYCEEIIPKEKLEIHIKVFNGFCKIGFIQLMFSAIESSFRIFLRELDPQACIEKL